jgi:hypothetical protein
MVTTHQTTQCHNPWAHNLSHIYGFKLSLHSLQTQGKWHSCSNVHDRAGFCSCFMCMTQYVSLQKVEIQTQNDLIGNGSSTIYSLAVLKFEHWFPLNMAYKFQFVHQSQEEAVIQIIHENILEFWAWRKVGYGYHYKGMCMYIHTVSETFNKFSEVMQ